MDINDILFQYTFESVYNSIDNILEKRPDIKSILSSSSNNLTKYFLIHDNNEKIAIAKSLTALIILNNNISTS